MRILPAVAALALVAGCEWATPPGTPYDFATLTADGSDTYTVAGGPAFTTVTAPLANTSGNTRLAFMSTSDQASVDQTTCATWVGSTHEFVQPGALLRWDGQHGVTVTRNVYGNAFTIINVHAWDTASATPFLLLAQFSPPVIAQPDGKVRPLPWRFCASAHGAAITFKVWPAGTPEPADGDPCCTGTTVITRTWAGRPGWFAGHLQPGHTLAYADLTTETN